MTNKERNKPYYKDGLASAAEEIQRLQEEKQLLLADGKRLRKFLSWGLHWGSCMAPYRTDSRCSCGFTKVVEKHDKLMEQIENSK